jgi:protein-disulfide isomerase
MKNPWVVVGLVAVVLFGGSFWYSSQAATKANEGVVSDMPHIKGNPEATVVLTEYSDFQCPACAAFQPALEDIMAEFGDRLKFEFKHFPLPIHSMAIPAARAAEAAGQQGKFFEFHDALFANQTTWTKSANPMVNFMQYATELGLDTDQFKRQYGSSLLKDRVQSELLAARDLNLTGTPTFFLNGVKMEIETFEDFYNQIAQAVGATTTAAAVVSEPVVEFGI